MAALTITQRVHHTHTNDAEEVKELRVRRCNTDDAATMANKLQLTPIAERGAPPFCLLLRVPSLPAKRSGIYTTPHVVVMSNLCIPSSKMAALKERAANDHRPVINASSTNVVSARERRERLLAYHVAVKLLEGAGVRKRRTSSPSKSELSGQEDDFMSSKLGGKGVLMAVPHCSSRPFFPDPVVERVQRAVEAYEQQHGRVLHDAISLDFVDAHGDVIVSPDISPKSSVAASSPRHGTMQRQSINVGTHHAGDNKKLPLPGREIMEKVKSIFDSGGFSYFEDRRSELAGTRRGHTALSAGPGARGGLPPPNEHAIAAMLQKVQGSSRTRSTPSSGAKPSPGIRGLHRTGPPNPLDAPLLHAQGQMPTGIDVSRLMALDEAARQETADAAQREQRHARHVNACIAAAVRTHLAATAGGKMRFTRRSSEAPSMLARGHPMMPQPSPHVDGCEDVGASNRATDMSQHCDVEGWLAHHPAIHDAVSATVDLLLLVLMKALPACLFAGDEARFTMLLEEERSVLMASAQLKWGRTPQLAHTANTRMGKPPPSQDSNSKSTPPMPLCSLGLTSHARLLGGSDAESTTAVAVPLDVLEVVDNEMIGLQLRASQRTERALSTIHANRLFLLIEVEQSMLGNNVVRLLDGRPLTASVGDVEDDEVPSRVGKRASPSRGTSAASPRRVEKIELERERRKRDASRPPKDPLQAVATSNHCWLSLTTARLRQLPFHACRDRVVATVAGIEMADEEDTPASPLTTGDMSPREFAGLGMSSGSAPLVSPGTPHQLTPRLEPRPPSLPSGAINRTTSAGMWSRRSASSASAEQTATNPNGNATRQARNKPTSATTHSARTKSGPGVVNDDKNSFTQPEPTILPIADVLSVLNDPANYERTDGGRADGDRFAPRAGTKLQDVVGPVELRLLLDVSTAYASLVQSLHSGGSGTSYARFLERNRDQLLCSSSDVIVNASIEYLDGLISSPDGRRGIPRPLAPSPRDANDGDAESDEHARQTPLHDARHPAAPYKGLLASLRPFGKKTELTKAQADAVLAACAQSASAGGLMVGNEHDAQRAAQHLTEQNRAVLHEVLARVKGEVQFLLTGVDGREKILEEEQIAIERQRQTRKAMRKLRETRSTSPASPMTAQASNLPPVDVGPAVTGAAGQLPHVPHVHHHAFTALVGGHHRGSLLRAAVGATVKGSDIVGQANEARFRSMLHEMVGSSSEEEEVRQEAAYEAHDIMRPVFDWQRQNFSRRSRRHRQHRSAADAKKPPNPSSAQRRVKGDDATDDSATGIREEAVAAAPATAKSSPPVAPPTTSFPLTGGRNSVVAPTTVPPTVRNAVPPLLSIVDLGVSVPPPDRDASKRTPVTSQLQTMALSTSMEVELPSHLSPTAASSNRARLVQERLAKRQDMCANEGGLEASVVISPRSDGALSLSNDASVRQGQPMRPRLRSTRVISPRGFQNPIKSGGSDVLVVVSSPSVVEGPTQIQERRRSSSVGKSPAVRGPGGVAEENAAVSKLTGRLNKLRHGIRGSILSAASSNNTAPPVPGSLGTVLSDKSRSMVRASEGLSMVDLQRELVVLERNRRRSGRSGQPKPPSQPIDERERGHAEDGLTEPVDPVGATPPLPSSTNALGGVTASVIGEGAAATVEKFKKACGATIQHFYGALDGTEGTAWYEQGRPCAAARSVRVAAIRGVQQGRFDLSALTPIAALRLAVATTILDGGAEASPSLLGGGGAPASGAVAPALVYPRLPNRTAGGDLFWTL